MGSLRTAGLLSGLGSGLGQGLQQLQSGIIQQGLMESRFAHDDARAAAATTADQAFQMKKMELQQTHETQLQQGTQAFTSGQNTLNREQAKTLHEQTEAGANARNAANNTGTLANTRLGHDMTNEGDRAKDKALDARQRLEIQKDIQVAKIQAGKGLEKKTDPGVKAQIDAEMKMLDIYGDQLKNSLDPSDIPAIEKKLSATKQNIGRLVGVEPPTPPAPGTLAGDKWQSLLKPKGK